MEPQGTQAGRERSVTVDVHASVPLFPEKKIVISLLITVPEKLRYGIKPLIYEAREGFFLFYETFLFSSLPPPGFAPSPPPPPPPRVLYSLARGGVPERKESERQADRTRDICPRQQTDGGRKPETRFSFSPFLFPLADSKKLKLERDANLLLCHFVLLRCPVRPGEGREGGRAVTLSPRFSLLLILVLLHPTFPVPDAGSSISILNCSVVQFRLRRCSEGSRLREGVTN